MFGLFLWRRDRRYRQTENSDKGRKPEASITFVQPKAELDAGQTRFELDASISWRDVEAAEMFELEVHDRRQEIKGDNRS